MAGSSDSIEPTNRYTAHDSGSAPLPAISLVTGEIAAVGNMLLHWLGPPPLFGQVGRPSPQPWSRNRRKSVSRPIQPIGACPGLHFTSQHTFRSGPDCLFRRGIAGLDGWPRQRQTRGLELAAEHETGKHLLDYADENFCLMFGPNSPTTNPYNCYSTPNILGIVITKNVSFPLYLFSWSTTTSDHLPVLIHFACRSSLHHPKDRPNFTRTD